MTKNDMLKRLVEMLCEERGERLPKFDGGDLFPLFRALVNVRPPIPASEEFLHLQDAFLERMLQDRGVVRLDDITPILPDIYLWQGDITRLATDGIVNAANSEMLGCFCPNHKCIDNTIHTFAGVQLRLECAEIMRAQGRPEQTGRAKITKAYNLPCKYVLHTVGPIVYGALTNEHERLLESCYRSCLQLAEDKGLESLAFCCISTGEFHFPNERAAQIAVETVLDFKRRNASKLKVVFNVFKDTDLEIYDKLLSN